MKNTIFFILLLIGFCSCKKEKNIPIDYREEITGDYLGIKVITYWVDTVIGYGHDTSAATISLEKSNLDSFVDVDIIPFYFSEEGLEYKFRDGELIWEGDNYHPPMMKIENDSVYFKHQPGLGPRWIEFFAEKQ